MVEDTAGAALLFALAVTIHNVEEWIWLPGFPHPPALKPPSAFAFRFAVAAITLPFWALAAGLVLGFPVEPVLAGFAAAMIVNAAVPHLAASLWLRRYHPGTGTAWLLVVPAALNALATMDAAVRLGEPSFALGVLAGAMGLAVSVPLLLAIGRRVELCKMRRPGR